MTFPIRVPRHREAVDGMSALEFCASLKPVIEQLGADANWARTYEQLPKRNDLDEAERDAVLTNLRDLEPTTPLSDLCLPDETILQDSDTGILYHRYRTFRDVVLESALAQSFLVAALETQISKELSSAEVRRGKMSMKDSK